MIHAFFIVSVFTRESYSQETVTEFCRAYTHHYSSFVISQAKYYTVLAAEYSYSPMLERVHLDQHSLRLQRELARRAHRALKQVARRAAEHIDARRAR